MRTYILLNTDAGKRADEIARQTASLGISPFDCITPTAEGPSIGIAEIRGFIKRLMLKPLEGTYSAGIITRAELLTLEAQQALLKTLEEPPDHAYIFLGAANNLQLIPTIMSRCTTISLTDEKIPETEEGNTDIRTLIDALQSATPGKKIHLAAQAGKSKDEVERFINASVSMLRHDLVSENIAPPLCRQKIHLVHQLLAAKKHLVHNVNPQLLLEQALF